MIVIVLENAPAGLRGRLSLWLSEIRAGTYVGVYSARQRQRIWDEVAAMIGPGSAVMAWTSRTSESGFAFTSLGPDRRSPVMVDGLTLVRFAPRGAPQPSETP